MRLRPLTEAECYARCYGGFRTDQVSVLLPGDEPAVSEKAATGAASRERAESQDDSHRQEAA
jgi:hypothetical protein